jgi:hypothetical protein
MMYYIGCNNCDLSNHSSDYERNISCIVNPYNLVETQWYLEGKSVDVYQPTQR